MSDNNMFKLAIFFQNKYSNLLQDKFLKHSYNDLLSASDYLEEIYFIKSFAAAKKNKGIATKTNPKLWARCKSEAKSRMGGKHSARAMQLALKLYKKRGGGFKGKKPTAKTNKMKKWTKQKWMYLSDYKKKSKNKADDHNNAESSIEDMNLAKGRYLPESKWKSLTPSEREATDRKKKQQGKHKQYVQNTEKAKVRAMTLKKEIVKNNILSLAEKFETTATIGLKMSLVKKSNKNWWELSEDEKTKLLKKEIDLGNGLKFQLGEVPELVSQIDVPAGPEEHHPEKNQLLHTALTYDSARRLSDDPMIWFAALLHDLGKSHTDKNIWPKQHGHEEGGVPYVEIVSNELGVSPQWKEFAIQVARHHLNCHRAQQLNPKTLRKLFDSFQGDKELFKKFITSCQADHEGRLGFEGRPYESKDYLLKKLDQGFEEPKQNKSQLAISGDDIQKEFGLKPGPELGKIMSKVKEIVQKNPELNSKEYLLSYVKNSLIV